MKAESQQPGSPSDFWDFVRAMDEVAKMAAQEIAKEEQAELDDVKEVLAKIVSEVAKMNETAVVKPAKPILKRRQQEEDQELDDDSLLIVALTRWEKRNSKRVRFA
ncbi:MAG: hypothetical protein KC483_10120 [Nitrosarchaeum sp.]|nr:hypothetical protein [Nitrosarchaeum sp.]